MNRLKTEEFDKAKAKIDEYMETNRLAIRDNFSQLLATDNFLEKYLPFRMQNLISESILSLFGDDRLVKIERMQHIDKGMEEKIENFRSTCLNRYKKFEYKTYKRMHKTVISD